MALDALLARLEGRAVTPVTADEIPGVTPRPAPMLACTPVTAENDDTAGDAPGDPLPNPAMEGRRQRVLAMLDERRDSRYAVLIVDPDTDPLLLTVTIRDVATFELAIPAARFDAFGLLDLLDRHGSATVH